MLKDNEAQSLENKVIAFEHFPIEGVTAEITKETKDTVSLSFKVGNLLFAHTDEMLISNLSLSSVEDKTIKLNSGKSLDTAIEENKELIENYENLDFSISDMTFTDMQDKDNDISITAFFEGFVTGGNITYECSVAVYLSDDIDVFLDVIDSKGNVYPYPLDEDTKKELLEKVKSDYCKSDAFNKYAYEDFCFALRQYENKLSSQKDTHSLEH